MPKNHNYCFVYLIAEETHGIFKIGVTNDVKGRIAQHRSSNPFIKIKRLFLYQNAQSAFRAEKSLHRRFGNNHVSGEWFRLSIFDLEIIGVLAKQKNGYITKSINEMRAEKNRLAERSKAIKISLEPELHNTELPKMVITKSKPYKSFDPLDEPISSPKKKSIIKYSENELRRILPGLQSQN